MQALPRGNAFFIFLLQIAGFFCSFRADFKDLSFDDGRYFLIPNGASMSATIYIKSKSSRKTLLPLVRAAIEGEIARMELAIEMANKRLRPFEEKYNVTSDYFISSMTAEDLEGRDEEYVSWAGEYQLKQRLQTKLKQLREIVYDASDLSR